MESLQGYAEATSSTMLYLLLALVDQSASDEISHAASHLGLAHSFTTLLRAFPYHASKGVVVIPAEITGKHNVRQEDVLRNGFEAKGIEDVVYEFACQANNELSVAREMVPRVPDEAMPVFLTAVRSVPRFTF
jgi:NADH dehydrogenase [ubiquinone] 1 alpha subcomplex assembly factor 6